MARQNKTKTPKNLLAEKARLEHRLAQLRAQLSLQTDLLELSRRFASFPVLNPNPVLEVDLAGAITFANPAAHQILEQLGLDPANVNAILPTDLDRILRDWDQKSVLSIDREIRLQGKIFRETVALVPELRVAHICVHDITEHKRAEEALASSNRKIAQIVESINDTFVVLDRNWNFIYASKAAGDMVGVQRDQLLGQNIWTSFPNLVGTVAEENYRAAMEKGETRQFEMFGPNSDKFLNIRVYPSEEGISILTTDITERKQAEAALRAAMLRIRNLNADLEQRAHELAIANEELERLATSLALDLRAPLISLRGISHVLAQDYGAQLPPQAQPLLQVIHANAEEMEDLTQGLLRLMHVTRQPLRKQELNLEEIVRAAWAELQAEWKGRPVELTIGNLPACRADSLLLKQVWANLLSNALQATRHRDPARIEIGARPEGKRNVHFVRDNGVGFDMSYAGAIFRAFQRYHHQEEWGGSGIGLAIVESIVRRHGGRVWAESAVDEGATFYFEL